MRRKLLVSATLSALAIVGCSNPAPKPDQNQAGPSRDLRMVEAPAATTPASDLEVGRRPIQPISRTAPQHQAHRPDEATKNDPIPAGALAAIALERAPTLSATGLAASPPAAGVEQTLVQAPAAVEMFPAGGLRPAPVNVGSGPEATYAGRGPTIIIRGGRGGIDDDCDLDRPGIHGHGAAVNRSAPAFGGGLGGQVPRVGGRFPRGIR